MASLLQEFRKFAVKGNMIELAVGIIIGAAFNKIVDSLVKNIITPPLGYLTAGVDFTELNLVLKPPVKDAAGEIVEQGVVIGYGLFLQAFIDFLIVAFVLFLIIRGINSMKEKAEDPKNTEVPTPKDIQLLSEIRDLLAKDGTPTPPQP